MVPSYQGRPQMRSDVNNRLLSPFGSARSGFVPTLSLSLSLVLVAEMSLVRAQTGFGCLPQPVDFSSISEYENPGPIWAVLCPGPPDPICTQAAAPAVEFILQPGTYDQFLVHEARIRATIPAEGTVPFLEMRVWGQYRDNNSSPWQNLWLDAGDNTIVSADALVSANRVNNGTQALYGATGLEAGKQHRFRVSFCRQEAPNVRGCTCWSPWSSTFFANTAYPSNVLQPASIVERFQDEFDRRESEPHRKRDGSIPTLRGDGAGATSVWADEASGASAGNGSQIEVESGTSFLWMPENGSVAYAGQAAKNTHTWADLTFRPLSSQDKCNGPNNPAPPPDLPKHNRNYRVDLTARLFSVTFQGQTVPSNYLVQIVSEPDFGGGGDSFVEPTLRVLRTVNGVGAILVSRTLADLADDSTEDDCKDLQTLLQPIYAACPTTDDTTISGNVATVRIEVKNNTSTLSPVVTATLMWNCSSTSCLNQCSMGVTDNGIDSQDPLYIAMGRYSVTSHHWDTRADKQRFGSAPAPQ